MSSAEAKYNDGSSEKIQNARKHAEAVKASHKSLRNLYKNNSGNFPDSWSKYLENKANLDSYGEHMGALAKLWKETQSSEESRIEWFKETVAYFYDNKLEQVFDKLVRREDFEDNSSEEPCQKRRKREMPVFSGTPPTGRRLEFQSVPTRSHF